MSEAASPAKMPRDVRLDHIGFVDELQKQFANPLKTKVKADFAGKSIERASGDCFDGLVVTGTRLTVDPEKFLRLFERKAITRAQFVAAISVGRDAAIDCVSREDLAKISTEAPTTPSLRVGRIKGVEINLVDAVRSIAAAIG